MAIEFLPCQFWQFIFANKIDKSITFSKCYHIVLYLIFTSSVFIFPQLFFLSFSPLLPPSHVFILVEVQRTACMQDSALFHQMGPGDTKLGIMWLGLLSHLANSCFNFLNFHILPVLNKIAQALPCWCFFHYIYRLWMVFNSGRLLIL